MMTAPPDFEAMAREFCLRHTGWEFLLLETPVAKLLRETYARGAADERATIKAALTKHGCSNHGCRVGFYSQTYGAGTNSSCQCIREMFRMEEHEAHAGVRQLQQIFADLHEAIRARGEVKP